MEASVKSIVQVSVYSVLLILGLVLFLVFIGQFEENSQTKTALWTEFSFLLLGLGGLGFLLFFNKNASSRTFSAAESEKENPEGRKGENKRKKEEKNEEREKKVEEELRGSPQTFDFSDFYENQNKKKSIKKTVKRRR